jgi:hypothetical protein
MTVRDAQQHRRGFEAFKPVCASVLINSPGSLTSLKLGYGFGKEVRR